MEELKNMISRTVIVRLRGNYHVEGTLDKVDQNKTLHLSRCKHFSPGNAVIRLDKFVLCAKEYDPDVQLSSSVTVSSQKVKTIKASSTSSLVSAASLPDAASSGLLPRPNAQLQPASTQATFHSTQSFFPETSNMIRVVPTKTGRFVLPQKWATLQAAIREQGRFTDLRTGILAIRIAEYCEKILSTSHIQGLVPSSIHNEVNPNPFPKCVILARHGFNGLSAIKAGILLVAQHWQVTLYPCAPRHLLLDPAPTKRYETTLLAFLSDQGSVITNTYNLPLPHLVIEAIFDTPNRSTYRGTEVNPEAVHALSWLRSIAGPHNPSGPVVLSIDIASFVDYDTGMEMGDLVTLDSGGNQCLTQFYPPPTTHLICAAALPRGCLFWKGCPQRAYVVDIGYSQDCLDRALSNTTNHEGVRRFFSKVYKNGSTSGESHAKPYPTRWVLNGITHYGDLSMLQGYGLAPWGLQLGVEVELR